MTTLYYDDGPCTFSHYYPMWHHVYINWGEVGCSCRPQGFFTEKCSYAMGSVWQKSGHPVFSESNGRKISATGLVITQIGAANIMFRNIYCFLTFWMQASMSRKGIATITPDRKLLGWLRMNWFTIVRYATRQEAIVNCLQLETSMLNISQQWALYRVRHW